MTLWREDFTAESRGTSIKAGDSETRGGLRWGGVRRATERAGRGKEEEKSPPETVSHWCLGALGKC